MSPAVLRGLQLLRPSGGAASAASVLKLSLRSASSGSTALPMAGMRVLELASVLAGPTTGQFLAELGADVIKVENPTTRGDVTRGWRLKGEAADGPSAYFKCCNMGKRSVALDASGKVGQDLVRRLAGASDIVLASYKPGDDNKLGLDAAALRAANPRLIYAQITGYGMDDPRVGYDAVIQAEAGFTFMNGEPGERGRPTKMPVALVDLLAAHQLKEAVLLALWRRERTGEGSHVHVSLMGAAVSSLANQATGYLCAGVVPQRMGSEHPSISPYGSAFDDRDGQPLILAVGADAQFRTLVEILGCAELAADPRFQTNVKRVAHRDELKGLLAERISKWSRADLLAQLDARKVPAGAVADMRTVFEQPQARRLAVAAPNGEVVGLRQVAWSGDGVAEGLPRRPPDYAQHTAEVLVDVLNMSMPEVEALVAAKVVDVPRK